MCLSIALDRPDDVLARGEHLGFKWMVIHNRMGYRCGYVRIPNGHPWHGGREEDINADIHGGITFGDHDRPCDKGGPDDAYWIGFDCAHAGDAVDPSLPGSHHNYGCFSLPHETIKDQRYIENECRSLCEQAFRVQPNLVEIQ